MEEKLREIEILENCIKDLEEREPFLSNYVPDIKQHIKILKKRKAKLEQELR